MLPWPVFWSSPPVLYSSSIPPIENHTKDGGSRKAQGSHEANGKFGKLKEWSRPSRLKAKIVEAFDNEAELTNPVKIFKL